MFLPPVITVDGPSGVGKSTLCQALANKLGWRILDSGAIYRVMALAALNYYIDIKSEKSLVSLAYNLDIFFKIRKKKLIVIFEGKDVSTKISSEFIGNKASLIATFPCVRKVLMHRQREFRTKPGLIANGRDMGTVVFLDAPVKIFLDATLEERTYRRLQQLRKIGVNIKLDDLSTYIEGRDYRDRNRIIAPLVPAKDALILNSIKLSIEEVFNQVITYIKKKQILFI
ncbi:MAG: (d)CMP kinase [Arsenophonus endosymbiont of Ceratovacuna japonica]